MIRWITDYLGTAPATSAEINPSMAIVDVRDLVDKAGNPVDAVRLKIEQGVNAIREGRRLVVCCDYGISRSNSVAAGILSMHAGVSFDEAVAAVSNATNEFEFKLEPLNVVRAALEPSTSDRPARSGEETSEPRVLLTGGHGFIGTALRAKLGSSHFIVAPTRANCDLLAGATALDQNVKRHRVNQIVHLANPRVYTSARAVGDMTTMLRNTLDVCRENSTRLVFLSSWEVYSGYRATELSADEALPFLPKGPYGEAKMLGETLIDLYVRNYALDCVVVRASPVFGRGSDRPKFIYNFLDKARRNEPIRTHEYRNGPPKLDLMHVDDLIRGLAAVLTTKLSGAIHFGTGTLTSTRMIAHAIVAKTGSHSEIDFQTIDDEAPNVRMDCRRALALMGWRPKTSFNEGLDEMIASKSESKA